ncbi:aspartic peptidase domain-containing protein [Mycena rosella]|uniref:Aspartic peptidase domain-containing protein n=1 Tax=Mycena rosella TaxID=1033263 RepID=A0AAD7G7V8_MYCRO|nr:aspartic peptidase domain-containing protein [Mycena rosella]
MVLMLTLLPAILLALRVAAGPVLVEDSFISLPISRRFNFTGPAQLCRTTSRASTPPRRAASVGVGSPATTYSLIVDTGSSNTWVGATQKYVVTSTSTKTTQAVSVSYGSGSFSGTEYTDQVTLASGLVISKQSIGVASTSSGFDGGTLTKSTSTLIPTVTDNLFSQGTITSNLIGISFEPTTTEDDVNGSIAFGAPIARSSPALSLLPTRWAFFDTPKDGTTSILASTAGIVDTGTTLIYIATNAFTKYKSATGGVADANTGLLKITATQFAALKNLNFVIGGVTYALTPNAQIWPRSLNTAIGGTASSIYLVVADWGSNSGEGLDFINGYAFLERFYSVFDTANKRVGFATTPMYNLVDRDLA